MFNNIALACRALAIGATTANAIAAIAAISMVAFLAMLAQTSSQCMWLTASELSFALEDVNLGTNSSQLPSAPSSEGVSAASDHQDILLGPVYVAFKLLKGFHNSSKKLT
jgi:hypothetical protein